MQLPVWEMLEEAVTYEPGNVLPVVVPFVSDFFQQDGSHGNHRRECEPKQEELKEKFAAQHTQASRESNRCNPYNFDHGCKQLEQPQVREGKATNPAVAGPKEHVPIWP